MKLVTPEIKEFNNWSVEEMPLGFVMPGGVSQQYITGGWRSQRPVWDAQSCTNCMMCWISCPDSSILVKDEAMVGIDYDHCKGCGICVNECRFGCLEMIREDQAESGKGE
jgi:pyruvate ferredoxin oxidoreductase delta subunit